VKRDGEDRGGRLSRSEQRRLCAAAEELGRERMCTLDSGFAEPVSILLLAVAQDDDLRRLGEGAPMMRAR